MRSIRVYRWPGSHYMVTVMPSALSLSTTVESIPVHPEASMDLRRGNVTSAVKAASVSWLMLMLR